MHRRFVVHPVSKSHTRRYRAEDKCDCASGWQLNCMLYDVKQRVTGDSSEPRGDNTRKGIKNLHDGSSAGFSDENNERDEQSDYNRRPEQHNDQRLLFSNSAHMAENWTSGERVNRERSGGRDNLK